MITDDQALEALRAANPATDEQYLPEATWTTSALLEDTARRMAMKTHDTKLTKLEPRRPRRSKGLLIAVAAFAVTLVVVGVGVFVFSEDEPSRPAVTTAAPTTTLAPTTAAPTTTVAPTTTAAPTTVAGLSEAEAREIVDSAFVAFNTGDMETWVLWREGGEGSTAPYNYQLAAGARLDVERCTYRGFQEWMMDRPMLGHGFDCAVTYTDRLLEAAGIELQMTYNWVIGDDPESSAAGSNEDLEPVGEFFNAYHAWLLANHPEVSESMYPGGVERRLIPSASVPSLLEYVDEFVAQSDVYPLTEPVPEVEFGGPLIGT